VAASSAALAANQGLYNGFLAAGLLWALWTGRRDLKGFFLGCVIVAGYGSTARLAMKWTRSRISSSRRGWAAIVMVPSRSEAVLALNPRNNRRR